MKIILNLIKLVFLNMGLLGVMTGCSLLESHGELVKPAETVNQQEALSAHNKFRALHSAPPLTWDVALAEYAKRHAAKCKFKHSGSSYGENIAMGYPSIAKVVEAWYSEKSLYSYQNPGFSMKTGHFTQVVWKSTRKLGCGYALCAGENNRPWKFWVCEYSPHGNIINEGYFKANVNP